MTPKEEQELWYDHIGRTEYIVLQIERLYRKAVLEYVRLGLHLEPRFNPDGDKMFAFASFPGFKERAQRILRSLHKDITGIIATGIEREWHAANAKNDQIIDDILKGYKVDRETLEKLKYRNLEALKAFQQRKVGGMGLSERVWKYTETFESEMELILDVSLGQGKSATRIAQEAQPLLNEPNRLFRRVRDKRGVLRPSKAMKAYNPGPGIYKSSFKNSFRMARTEVNMAYRVADHERRMATPFIVGYEVRRSNNPYPCDICDAMKGRYPKSYIFRSVHPSCRCYVITILATPDEIENWINSGVDGPIKSVNEVTQMPQGWKEYVKKNRQRILKAKEPPYWVRDNFKGANIMNGLKIDLPI